MDVKGIRRIINSIFKNGLSGRMDKPFLIYSFSAMENSIAVMYRYMGLIRKCNLKNLTETKGIEQWQLNYE